MKIIKYCWFTSYNAQSERVRQRESLRKILPNSIDFINIDEEKIENVVKPPCTEINDFGE